MEPKSLKILSWNIAGMIEPWHWLVDSEADVALLQEAGNPPAELNDQIGADGLPWSTPGYDGARAWRAAVVKLSNDVTVQWIDAKLLHEAGYGELGVSRPGTLAAAHVEAPGLEPLMVVSAYSLWTGPHRSTGSSWIVSDASAHRLVSDISMLIGKQSGHRIIVAGDFNILHGHGEYGSPYWAARYGTVFDRMEALGLPFVGPQHPFGRQAVPWPDELPCVSKNVPTFHSSQQTPAAATRQLDFVFASRGLEGSLQVRALNEPDQWGPSDHCRLEIEVR